MYAIIGEDRPLFDAKVEHSEPVFTRASQVDALLARLWREPADMTQMAALEDSILGSKYFRAIRTTMEERKRELSMPFLSCDDAKLEEQSRALEKSTSDCMSTIENIEKDHTDEVVSTVDTFLHKARDELPIHLEIMRQEAWKCELKLVDALQKHGRVRPVNAHDVEGARRALQMRSLYWTNQVRNDFCNCALLSSTMFLKKQKRRNFPKKATQILNDYFEAHMDQPYPDENTKKALADKCGVTTGQVSNWFGNKRIRFKKALERQDGHSDTNKQSTL